MTQKLFGNFFLKVEIGSMMVLVAERIGAGMVGDRAEISDASRGEMHEGNALETMSTWPGDTAGFFIWNRRNPLKRPDSKK